MKKLISMIDFVLEQVKECTGLEKIGGVGIAMSRIHKYAKFLKQSLKLGMFVPCDEDGNVLQEPLHYAEFSRNETNNYQKAKERCLFEGLDIDAVNHHIYQKRNVEYLANFGDLQLTQTAINLIGL